MELFPNSPRRRTLGSSRLSSSKLQQLAASQLRHWASQQAAGGMVPAPPAPRPPSYPQPAVVISHVAMTRAA